MMPLWRAILAAWLGLATAGLAAPARAEDMSLHEKWAEVEANAAIFRKTAARLRFTGDWEKPKPITLRFDPPATEAEVAAVEAELGERLPESLRAFFLQASAGIDILWLMPGRIRVSSEGVTDVTYDLLPPPPFQERSAPFGPESAQTVPSLNGTVFRLSLATLVEENESARQWPTGFRKWQADAKDDGEAAHYRRYAEFWERGLCLTGDGGGNYLAVDRSDPEGRLIFLFHDGSDEPGWFLEQTLIDFLVTQSRLGFPGIGQTELLAFADPSAPPGPMAQRYAEIHAAEAERLGLAMPASVEISTDAPDADIWRAWLGL